jgi:hypothetical protein
MSRVPKSVAEHESFNLKNYISSFTFTTNNKSRVLTAKKQIEYLNNTMKKRDRFTYCITGDIHAKKAQVVANKIRESRSNNYIWHFVNSSKWDRLRDEQDYRSQFFDVDLVIIDGVNYSAERSKLDKVFDLINMWDDVNIIIIGCGSNPIDLMYNKINQPVNRVLYLSEKLDETI